MDRSGSKTTTRHALLLAGLTLAALLPFVGKAFHIDDPLFVWCAVHVQSHPFDFYGFEVNWNGLPAPMSEVTRNPPLASYYLALVGSILGWSERALHIGFLLPAMALVLGTYRVARRFCSRPEWAGLATVTAPVFLVSGTSVMCDTLMVALWVWALHFWLTGLESGSRPKLSVAVALVAACSLTKYFGIALVPLLFAASWLERRRVGWWATYLLVPVVALALFHYLGYRLYGPDFVFSAVSYATDQQVGGELLSKIMTGLAFCGGCMIVALFAAPLLWTGRVLAGGGVAAIVIALAVAAVKNVGDFAVVESGHANWLFIAQFAALAVSGAGVLALAVTDWLAHRTAAAALLFLWVFGTLVFACGLNWTVSGRNVLPMLPGVAILVVRRLEHRGGVDSSTVVFGFRAALLASLAIALLTAYADFALANSARLAASALTSKLEPISSGVAFEGHWGFQYYMERHGARPLASEDLSLTPNEAIVVPLGNSYLFHLPDDRVEHWFTYRADVPRWLSTMNGRVGAGYYSDGWGPLPYVFGRVQAEEYRVYRVK